jgi:hypothetical protein
MEARFKLVLSTTFATKEELEETLKGLMRNHFSGRLEPMEKVDGLWVLDKDILEGMNSTKVRGK